MWSGKKGKARGQGPGMRRFLIGTRAAAPQSLAACLGRPSCRKRSAFRCISGSVERKARLNSRTACSAAPSLSKTSCKDAAWLQCRRPRGRLDACSSRPSVNAPLPAALRPAQKRWRILDDHWPGAGHIASSRSVFLTACLPICVAASHRRMLNTASSAPRG